MRFFQSSITTAIVSELYKLAPELKVNVLRSYRTDGPETLRLLESGLVQTEDHILDSGVWGLTQGTLKHKSNVKIYGKSLKRIGNKFRFYMNFDEIFMDEGTEEFDDRAIATNLKNQKYLESQGLNPVPVIHSLDDDEIDYYIGMKQAKGYEYIAIGSTQAKVQKERKKLKDAVDKLYMAGYKVHIFGVGSYNNLTGLKAWSCDASSFAQWASCGRVIFLSEQSNKAKKEITFSFLSHDESGDPVEDFIDDHKEGNAILAEYQTKILDPLGLNIETLYSDPFSRMLANCYYYCQLEKILTEEQVKAGVKFDEW
jgi:hypothetical protein